MCYIENFISNLKNMLDKLSKSKEVLNEDGVKEFLIYLVENYIKFNNTTIQVNSFNISN